MTSSVRSMVAATTVAASLILTPAAHAADQPAPETCKALRDVLVGKDMIRPDLSTPVSRLRAKLTPQTREELAVAAVALGKTVAPDADKVALAGEIADTALRCELVRDDRPAAPSLADSFQTVIASGNPVGMLVKLLSAGSSLGATK